MYEARAVAATRSGSRFVKQLLSHWRKEYQVEHDDARSVITFGFGTGTLVVTDEQILCTVSADDEAGLDRARTSLVEHLEWFGRKEDLKFVWESESKSKSESKSESKSGVNSRLPGLRDLSVEQRRARVAEARDIAPERLAAFDPANGLTVDVADSLVENVVGGLTVPLGVATNFRINGRDYLIPMATEEPSVIAAASNAARIARESGGFAATASAPIMIAQIQVVEAANPYSGQARVYERRDEIIELANKQDPLLISLGGGVRDVTARVIASRSGVQVIVHLEVDVRDAMGANTVNTMAEAVAPFVAETVGGRPLLRILSNKADLRLVRVRAAFPVASIGGERVARDIVHASAFAEADPYRAATHNKGILNGISALVLATGNDTRAVEAGAHSHAARGGQYCSLSQFELGEDGAVHGTLEIPMAVGLVGGATRSHPTAQAAVELLGVKTATELAEVIASVGLAQNFAAVRALADEGIQKGHMGLHARTIAVAAGARGEEIAHVAAILSEAGVIRGEKAIEVLADLRRNALSPGGH